MGEATLAVKYLHAWAKVPISLLHEGNVRTP